MTTTVEKAPTAQKTPWTPPNGNWKTYDLHCHCGTIRYRMKLSPHLYEDEVTPEHPERCVAINCYCSYCARNGQWTVHPLFGNVEWTKGLDHRGEYRIGENKYPYGVCRKCCCFLGTDSRELIKKLGFQEEVRCSINVRMLKNFDQDKMSVRDARAMRDIGAPYTVGDEQ
ncbi:hypothetical protein BAUCODRAFT_36615 [Baudoinia panamericana UAMH 10762]|uniref:CENP-V/GFA domain-containing protein n=1 Tax=Baudoinia panamericana (strain UAMH 10762) TaxID=717646 RepID=M2N536_BAUPA|nr:uncharacterized protein BAUCODRAFT_36615 [Baudoinia panamericana UAMH 10762]EMC94144.1 hypothetical protein BAUCODRAFT_36615 [Baudoinia panamericana UAMH 10762]